MSDDPLRTFIGRSLRADVEDVQSEVVARNASLEVERIRFRQDGAERSLVLKRLPPNDSLEVQLLPFLARKTDRVPAVHARGVPPPAARPSERSSPALCGYALASASWRLSPAGTSTLRALPTSFAGERRAALRHVRRRSGTR